MPLNTAAAILLLQAVLPGVAPQRIESVFQDIVQVAEEEHSAGRMKSGITLEDTVAALTAATVVESGLREEVEKCRSNGDNGRSIGLGQVIRGKNWEGHTREEICSNRKLQLQLSLHVIDRCWGRTPRPDYAFRCYASGDAAKKSHTATRESRMFGRVKSVLFSSRKPDDKLGAKLIPDSVSSCYEVLPRTYHYPYRYGHSYFPQRYSHHHVGSRVRFLRGGRHHFLHRNGGRQVVPRGGRGRFRR